MAQAEIPALFQQRSVVARHEKVAMCHPFIEAAALTLVDIPATLIILICYSVICYFATGLQNSAGQFLCV
jgi:ATP-binding cassette, subfamily G (WHITE), member 2, SNQ2